MSTRRVSRYVASLPERALRSLAAVAGGLVRELGDLTLPPVARRTRLYKNLVEGTLQFLIEQVGEVEGAFPSGERLAQDFLLRRAAGNGIEWIGLLTIHLSPVWVLAAMADVTGAGRYLIRDIGEALVKDGLLEPGRPFESVEQLLDGLERTAARLAQAINAPPLDTKALRQELKALREEALAIPAPELPDPERLRASWDDLRQTAASQQRSVFELSSVMALSAFAAIPRRVRAFSRGTQLALQRTGALTIGTLLDHYAATLGDLRERGFAAYWSHQFQPYLRAAAGQFSPGKRTWTERILGGE